MKFSKNQEAYLSQLPIAERELMEAYYESRSQEGLTKREKHRIKMNMKKFRRDFVWPLEMQGKRGDE